MRKLSERQQSILDFISEFLDENDYPPTIRDIQHELGISSTSVVDYNLKVLEDRNHIRRNRNISRGIEIVGRSSGRPGTVEVPVIGSIAAGQPIPVPGDLEGSELADVIELSRDFAPDGGKGLFGLRVRGHSMIDALIGDGDIVVLKSQETCENGETVVVWLEAEAETTLKTFYLEGSQVRLQPQNVTMDPIYTPADNVRIMDKLVSVVRSIH
jgi:repressor LexA